MLENARITWASMEIIESVVKGGVEGILKWKSYYVYGAIRKGEYLTQWRWIRVLENAWIIWTAIEKKMQIARCLIKNCNVGNCSN